MIQASTGKVRSHPAFCSARELTAGAALLGGHALDVVEGLTVRMQRVRVVVFVLPSFQRLLLFWPAASAFLPIPRGLWRRLSVALLLKLWTGPVPPLVCLLLWSWMMVWTDCPDDARILKAWYGDLRNRSLEQVVPSPRVRRLLRSAQLRYKASLEHVARSE